nr:ATPase, T2SS/T4P/T4SS family [uncultured Methanospirillum sp.]
MDEGEIGSKKRIIISPLTGYQISDDQVRILISTINGSISEYQILEPELTSDEKEKLLAVRRNIKSQISDKAFQARFSKNFKTELYHTAKDLYPDLDDETIGRIAYYIHRDAKGLGKIQPLIDDEQVRLISVSGPDQIITLEHSTQGTLFSTLMLNETEISQLITKLRNRASSAVNSGALPHTFTLRSGLHVTITGTSDDSSRELILEKTQSRSPLDNHSPTPSAGTNITEYRLYHELIAVKVFKSDNGEFFYHIGVIPLSSEEKCAVHKARQEDEKKSGLTSTGGRKTRLTSEEFARYLTEFFPLIPEERHHLLYISLLFTQDMVRWLRLLISDQRITRFRCTHPGSYIKIWHEAVPGEVTGCLKPKRSDLNRFADFLIKSSGQTINPDENEITLQFKTGEEVQLNRIWDDRGHYYRIDLKKHTNGSDKSSSVKKPGLKRSKPSVHSNRPLRSDPRIEELVASIFLREQKTPKADPLASDSSHQQNEESLNGLSAVVQPIKKGFQSLISFTTKKKEDTPETTESRSFQVPSVLNIQSEDGVTAEEAYWLYQPHSYVAITLDKDKERTYKVVEPELSPRERIILEETHETLRDVLVYDKPVTKGDLVLEFEEVSKVVKTYDPKISEDRLLVLYYYLRRNLNGYGKIDPLMYDELLEDISCNGHDLPVYVHHRYYGSIPTSIRFESEELNRFVLKLSQKADKQVSLTSPLLDASLPNGSRAQITYSDVVSTKGSSFTIRKFRSDPMTPATLLSFGTYSDELLAFIWLALENRQSLIVVGGTASGKTSAMNAFSFFIPHNSKIVSLEDTREIQIPQKNWLPVQTRTSSSFNDRGNVDLFDLLKASLRQRPEYIIVGEVRGNEAQTLFQAMNSGHTTISTLHAGNIEEALNRLTNEPINVPAAMFGALNLMVIQTFHYRDGRMIRRCDAIHEIVLGEGDKVHWNTLFEYDPKDDSFKRVYKKSKTLQTIQYMHNWSDEEIVYQLNLRSAFLTRLKNQHSTDPEVLIQMITDLRRLA